MIDERDVDWSAVTQATYRIEHTLRYEYSSPIADLRHRLVIAPRARHGDQRRLSRHLNTSATVPVAVSLDRFGNEVAHIAVAHVERSLTFDLESTVSRSVGSHHSVAGWYAHPLERAQRRLIRCDEGLADAAAEIRATNPNAGDRAAAIARYVHRTMTYTKGVTDVFTTAAVAFRMGRGVCQDYAHVTIALARASGLAARYVSGHLLGEGATHAWVEFMIPERDGRARVISLDPTHGCATSLRYVTIAVGRDYDDVAPTSGVFRGDSSGKLHGSQRVVLTQVAAA